jgi:hypothetical protein
MKDMSQKNKKFRLPRKIKKKLKSDLFTYPKSERNTYLIAWPYKYEKDYVAYKKGLPRVEKFDRLTAKGYNVK